MDYLLNWYGTCATTAISPTPMNVTYITYSRNYGQIINPMSKALSCIYNIRFMYYLECTIQIGKP
jgi:hypothetical protein